ncbi:Serine/threonine-protein phosphatase 7 long form-like protein [Hordeum vulgare]|nr:Serine/threonine-protein phosphatase 7 long form-like protein [Hordeum vulgare]
MDAGVSGWLCNCPAPALRPPLVLCFFLSTKKLSLLLQIPPSISLLPNRFVGSLGQIEEADKLLQSLQLVFAMTLMFQPDKYSGLDEYYEQKHRAVLIERGEVPPLLRLRGHNPNETLSYDPCYEPYFRRMDLLQFVLNFKGTPPWLNATALTSLTDRWRPETHSFHLPLGEMSITLEDIAMITGLPIESRALTRKVRTNRQSNKTVINWEENHMTWVDMWNAQRQHRVENDQTPDTDEAAYLRHLEWMRTEYIVIHKADWTRSDCLDLLPSEAADAAFNNSIRETVGAHLDYGPLHDRVKVVNPCRTLAALLSCHGVSSTDVRARAQYTMDVQSSARPSASRPRSSSARPSSSRAHASSSRAHVEEIEEEEESDNEAADPDFIEFGASQMEDAP